MELYHLHLKGYKDDMWVAGKEIVIDKNFDNRLSLKCKNNSFSVKVDDYKILAKYFNMALMESGLEVLQDRITLDHLIDVAEYQGFNDNVKLRLLKVADTMIRRAAIVNREMALENYRKDHNIDLPSRLHCIYAASTLEGVESWKKSLIDGDLELFTIEIEDEPYLADNRFLPQTYLTYSEMYDKSYNYWNYKFRLKDSPINHEYLIQGKIKIKEKIDEFKKI